MKDLTAEEEAEVNDYAFTFVQDRKLDGLQCVVIIRGRGINKVAFSKDDQRDAASMCADGYRHATQYSRSQTN